MLVIFILVSWAVFILIDEVTRGVKHHRFLGKSSLWVFIPFLLHMSSITKSDFTYGVLSLSIILILFFGKKKSIRELIGKVTILSYSIYCIVDYLNIIEEFKTLL